MKRNRWRVKEKKTGKRRSVGRETEEGGYREEGGCYMRRERNKEDRSNNNSGEEEGSVWEEKDGEQKNGKRKMRHGVVKDDLD